MQTMEQGITLEAQDICVCRSNKLILDGISFHIQPSTLTAIIGPNGAGKTTLMRALSGERPESGQVLINGQNLYDEPQYWLAQIGYVPVDNILHDNLALREALTYVGKLRLSNKDLPQIEARVDELLTQFDFPPGDHRRNTPIRNLSSGERKRANVCSELIIDPPLLMLDEPTSNLDPDAERNLMHLLADYAHNNGQTVLVITHTLNTIDVCDNVIFIENSRLTAAGRQGSVLETLEDEVSQGQNSGSQGNADASEISSFDRWAEVFEYYQTDEGKRLRCDKSRQTPEVAGPITNSQLPDTVPWAKQLRYLLGRYTKVRRGDKWSLIGTLLAGLSGVFFFILPSNTFVAPYDMSEVGLALNQARQNVYVVALVVTLIGLITSYREISREYRIYQHERLKGLSPSAYFMSKWIWLSAGVGVLAPILLVVFIVLVYKQPLPDFPEPRYGEVITAWDRLIRFQLVGLFTRQVSWLTLITLILACIASVTLGLFISVLAGDSDKGYLYLSFIVVFIVLFSGLIHNEKMEQLINSLSFLSTGKWAYEGFASSISLYCWTDSWRFAEFNSTGHIISIWLALALFTLVGAFLAIGVLRLRDPWYRHWMNMRKLVRQNLAGVVLFLAVVSVLFSYTLFLRQRSHEYHSHNYWSRQQDGGTGAYVFPNVAQIENLEPSQMWNGKISQSWCGDR